MNYQFLILVAKYGLAPIILAFLVYLLLNLIQNAEDHQMPQIITAVLISAIFGAGWLYLDYALLRINLSYDLFPLATPYWIRQFSFFLAGFLIGWGAVAWAGNFRRQQQMHQLAALWIALFVFVFDLAFFALALDRIAADMLWSGIVGALLSWLINRSK